MTNPAPTDLDELLSPEWLSETLSASSSPVRVKSVKVVETLKTVATKVRFEVEYESAPADMHRNFCVKGMFADYSPSGGGAGSQVEPLYYLELAPHSDVRVPYCQYAGIDPDTGHGIILMHDVVAAGGRFLSALEPYTPDQAAASLDQLALLHAERWNDAGLDHFPWLASRLDQIAAVIPVPVLQEMLDGERGDPLKPEIRSAERIHKGLAALSPLMAREPHCLVHGDAHAGNIYEMAGAPALIDWQLVQKNSWALDVPYHIGTTLTVEDREKSEQALLRHYLDRLRAYGIEPPEWDDAWFAYRTHMLYGYFLWAITRRVDPPIILEFVKRLGSAVAAHETFDLLGI